MFLESNKLFFLKPDYSDANYYKQDKPCNFLVKNKKHILKLTNGKALDIGCGSCRNSIYLKDNFNMSIDAFDSEPISKTCCNDLGIISEISNVNKYKYEKNHYDIILCFYITQHIKPIDQEKLFLNIKQSLKKDGLLFLGLYYEYNGKPTYAINKDKIKSIIDMKLLDEGQFEKANGSKKFIDLLYKN
jgi:SAM-dependent methyltransferase